MNLTLPDHELFVDNFAGGGGASTGIALALGRSVDHAINHDFRALGMHRINHPTTVHHCEDIFDIQPAVLTEGRPVGGAWFSPDCKHFSKAKGGKPLDQRIRGLVLVMLRWAKIRTRVMFMENVEEITTWGPLIQKSKDGQTGWYADPRHKGRTWRAFLDILGSGCAADHPDLPEILAVLDGTVTLADCVRGFGYHVETRELRACDFGAPTIRKRLFLVARCDGQSIHWPKPTHAKPKAKYGFTSPRPSPRFSSDEKSGEGVDKLKPWRAIAECIDWHLACPSIFLNKRQARRQKCKRPLAKSTLRRIATGVDRYVLKSASPFLVSLTHQGGDDRVEDINAPAKTLTGAHRGEKALVAPMLSKFHGDHPGRRDGAARNQPADEPLKTQDVSNRFADVEAKLVQAGNSDRGARSETPDGGCAPRAGEETAAFMEQSGHIKSNSEMVKGADEPLRTQAAGPSHNLVEARLAPFVTEHANSSNQRSMPADEPLRTQCANVKGGHFAAVAGSLVQTGYGEREGQKPLALDVDKPLGTIVSGGKHAVVSANLMVNTTQHPGGAAEDPLKTIATGGHHNLVTGTLVHTAHGEQDKSGKKRGRGVVCVNEPAPSCLGSPDCAVVTGTLVGAGGPARSGEPRPVEKPFHTLLVKNDSHLAATNLVKLRGDEQTHGKAPGLDEPGHTISAAGQHHGLVETKLAAVDGSGNPDRGARSGTREGACAPREGEVTAAFIAQHNAGFNTNPGHSAEDPASTISGTGSQQNIVAASMAAYYGNDEDGQAVNESARTVTTKERFGLVESECVIPSLTPEQLLGARRVAKFLRAHGVQLEGEFATVTGTPTGASEPASFVIVDIGMRMLTPRELFRAQGFGEDYVIDRAWIVDLHGAEVKEVRLTKEQQIRMCGNSVCPPVAAALVRANVPEMVSAPPLEQLAPA